MNAGRELRRSPTRAKRMMQIGQWIQMKSTSSVHGHATQTIARSDPNQSRSKSGQPLRECKLRLDPYFALPRKEISCSLSNGRRYDEIVGKEGVRVRSSLHQTISVFCPRSDRIVNEIRHIRDSALIHSPKPKSHMFPTRPEVSPKTESRDRGQGEGVKGGYQCAGES